MKQLYKFIFVIPFILTSLAIFILSGKEHLRNPLDDFLWGDKLVHVVAYFFYGITIIIALVGNLRNASVIRIVLLTLCIGTLYAIFDEFHQSFIPGRFACIYDVFADVTGIVISLFFVRKLKVFISKITLITLKFADKI